MLAGVRRLLWIAALLAVGGTAVPVIAASAVSARLEYADVLPAAGSGQVTVKTQRAASFRVVLRVPTRGRARLYLLGAKAPKGGPLVDTKTGPYNPAPCPRVSGAYVCRGAYEPLPKGTYTWRIVWSGAVKAPVELTVRW